MANIPVFIPEPRNAVSIQGAVDAIEEIRGLIMDLDLDEAQNAMFINLLGKVHATLIATRPIPGDNSKFPRNLYDMIPYLGTNVTEVSAALGVGVVTLQERAHGANLPNWPGDPYGGSFVFVATNTLFTQVRCFYLPWAENYQRIENEVAVRFGLQPNQFTLMYAGDDAYIPIGNELDWAHCRHFHLDNELNRVQLLVVPANP